MKIYLSGNKTISKIAIVFVLLYAIATRSVLSRILFASTPQVFLYYSICYLSLLICFINSFCSVSGRLYAPSGFFSIGILFSTTFVGMLSAGNVEDVILYGMAFLLPFSISIEIKENLKIIRAFKTVGIFIAIGTFLNFMMPQIYKALLPYVFKDSDLSSAQWVASMGTGFPGVFSQVNYTAFFLGIAIGAVFSFRKSLFSSAWIAIISFMFAGVLLTGKRGAVVYIFATLLFCYFIEGRGKEKLFRFFKIAIFAMAAYGALFLVAQATNIQGIKKIFETVQAFITGGQVDNTGRSQLQEQAWRYFASNPIFGIGWGNFRKMFTLRGTYVHCIYLQLLCEMGMVGAGIYYLFFLKQILLGINKFKATIVAEKEIENSWAEFSLFGIVYFLLFGLTENPIYDLEEFIFFMFFVGIINLPILKQNG